MFWQMREILESSLDVPIFVSAYWPAIDTLSHIYGYDHPAVAAELRSTFDLLQSEFLERLSPKARENTVFLLTADHGQVISPPEQYISLSDHPELAQMLLMRPAGEPRTAYLYARQGLQEAALAYLRENLGDVAWSVPSAQALEDGLLGPNPHAAETSRRVGDILLTMRDGYLFLHEDELEGAPRLLGRHGGMTAAEMEVPWLGFRLDRFRAS